MVDIEKLATDLYLYNRRLLTTEFVAYKWMYAFKHVEKNRIWCVHYTERKYPWATSDWNKLTTEIILISGTPDKLRYKIGTKPSRLYDYRTDKIKQGYEEVDIATVIEQYPEISETINKILFWANLKR